MQYAQSESVGVALSGIRRLVYLRSFPVTANAGDETGELRGAS